MNKKRFDVQMLNSGDMLDLSWAVFCETIHGDSKNILKLAGNVLKFIDKTEYQYPDGDNKQNSNGEPVSDITVADILREVIYDRNSGTITEASVNNGISLMLGNEPNSKYYVDTSEVVMKTTAKRIHIWNKTTGELRSEIDLAGHFFSQNDLSKMTEVTDRIKQEDREYGVVVQSSDAIAVAKIPKTLEDLKIRFERIMAVESDDAVLTTGFKSINKTIGGGFKLGHLCGVVARTHHGKSLLASAIFNSISFENDPELIRNEVMKIKNNDNVRYGEPTMVWITTEDSIDMVEKNMITHEMTYDDPGSAFNMNSTQLTSTELAKIHHVKTSRRPFKIIIIKLSPLEMGITNVIELLDKIRDPLVRSIDGIDNQPEIAGNNWIVSTVIDYPSLLNKSDMLQRGAKPNGDEYKAVITNFYDHCNQHHMFGMIPIQASPSAKAEPSHVKGELVRNTLNNGWTSDSSKLSQELQYVLGVEKWATKYGAIMCVASGKVKGTAVQEADKMTFLASNNPENFLSPNMISGPDFDDVKRIQEGIYNSGPASIEDRIFESDNRLRKAHLDVPENASTREILRSILRGVDASRIDIKTEGEGGAFDEPTGQVSDSTKSIDYGGTVLRKGFYVNPNN